MDDLIGRTLKGKFQITSHLGEGAMGSVYKGVELETGRDVAVKVMHPGLMKEPGMLSRFRREATAMRRVRHPNAVEVFAHGVEDGLVFLVMELVKGADLAEHLHAERRLAPHRAVRIVADVCGALAEAHAHGVVHRDIKPENVMVDPENGDVAKLIDFGIAKPTSLFAGDDGSSEDERSMDDSIPDEVHLASGFDLTSAGTLVGSPGYMAPEQWSSSAVDARTDLYACGVLLYELVTGRLPFEDTNPFMVAARQLREQPVAPHKLNSGVLPSLSAIILRALRPAPEERFQSAAEMRDTLCLHLVEQSIADVLHLGATLPVAITTPLGQPPVHSPFGSTLVLTADHESAQRKTLPLPDEAAPTQPLPVLFPEAPAAALPASDPAAKTLPLDMPPLPEMAIKAMPSASVARNGRSKTPIPPGPVTPRGARSRSSRPGAGAALVTYRARVFLPLAAAFLALGVALGLLLFMPAL